MESFQSLDFRIAVPRGLENLQDGKIFKSNFMEEKWNVYKTETTLIFTRSWTGEIIYLCHFIIVEDEIVCQDILANIDVVLEFSNNFIIQEFIFLVWTHVNGQVQPHPIPRKFEKDIEKCTAFSFQRYGRYAYFGRLVE